MRWLHRLARRLHIRCRRVVAGVVLLIGVRRLRRRRCTRAGLLREVGQRRIRHRQHGLKAGRDILRLLLALLLRLVRLRLRRVRCRRQKLLRDHVFVQMVSQPCQQAACHAARDQQMPDTARFFLRARFGCDHRAANRAEIRQVSFASRPSCGRREVGCGHSADFAGTAISSRQNLPRKARKRCELVLNLSGILSKCQSI